MTDNNSTATSPHVPLSGVQHDLDHASVVLKLIFDASEDYDIDEDHDVRTDVFRGYEVAANLLNDAHTVADVAEVPAALKHPLAMFQIKLLHVGEYCFLLRDKAGSKHFDRRALSAIAVQLMEDIQREFNGLLSAQMEKAA
ncbi:MAG: hypothetical protein Q7W55_09640 [Pseudohongiella sp.]|nr:hypothetical protein [Pseudohongiella sp.]